MLSINFSELIWTIINFFLLYFLLKRFLFDPVVRFTEARREKVEAGLAEERLAQAAVDENRERLDAEKAESRREAGLLIEKAAAEDEQHRIESVKAARSEAQAALETGEKRLQEQSERDEALLREQSDELSALLAARFLGQED